MAIFLLHACIELAGCLYLLLNSTWTTNISLKLIVRRFWKKQNQENSESFCYKQETKNHRRVLIMTRWQNSKISLWFVLTQISSFYWNDFVTSKVTPRMLRIKRWHVCVFAYAIRSTWVSFHFLITKLNFQKKVAITIRMSTPRFLFIDIFYSKYFPFPLLLHTKGVIYTFRLIKSEG